MLSQKMYVKNSEMNEETHFLWVSKMINRIVDASSLKPTTPLLCLSFAQKFPNYYLISTVPRVINLTELSKGVHYAIILYTIRELNFQIPSPLALFELILSIMKQIGYKPKDPCTPENLVKGRLEDHVNLCIGLEYAVADKSLSVEKLMDDLRKLPKSFFVLKDHPSHIDNAIKLWLNKFHCLFDLFDIEDAQSDIQKFAHVAAALSRVYPSRVRRSGIRKSSEMSSEDIEYNRKEACAVLDELGAFVPRRFPVDDKLFRVFISDLYYATRQNVKSFVKVDNPQPIVEPRPMSAKLPSIDPKCKNSVKQKILVRPSPRRVMSKPVIAILPPKRSEADDLLEIYKYMSKGDRRDKFVDVQDPKALIDRIVEMMERDENEQTFINLKNNLTDNPEHLQHMHNGVAFLTALSGNNNEFAASRRAVFFARRMMQTLAALAAQPENTEESRARTPVKIVRRRKVARVKSATVKLASVETQTASMTQTVVVIRSAATSSQRTGTVDVETHDEGCQTERLRSPETKTVGRRPMTCDPSSTISYPYGSSSGGFAFSSKRRIPVRQMDPIPIDPCSARRRRVILV